MSAIDFFDEVASAGANLMDSVRGRSDVRPFLRRTRDVFELLVEIHDVVVTIAAEASTASTLDEARHRLDSLESYALEAVFRARRWCDELEQLGKDIATPPATLDIDDQATWDEFSSVLQRREGDVARLYETAMFDILAEARNAASLEEFTSFVDGLSDHLVVQKARFDLLAKKAASIARRQ